MLSLVYNITKLCTARLLFPANQIQESLHIGSAGITAQLSYCYLKHYTNYCNIRDTSRVLYVVQLWSLLAKNNVF